MLCIIPAKGKSERLAGKNMARLGGKPLVQWTIEAAKESEVFSGIIVSSEDKATLRLAQSLGVTAHRRPKVLSGERVTYFTVVKELMADRNEDMFAVLLPTSPLRTPADICAAFALAQTGKAVMTVAEYESPPAWALTSAGVNLLAVLGWEPPTYLVPMYPDAYRTVRQDLVPAYYHDGSIIMGRTQALLQASDWLDLKPEPLVMERSVDITTQADLDYAEYLLWKSTATSSVSG